MFNCSKTCVQDSKGRYMVELFKFIGPTINVPHIYNNSEIQS